MPKYSLEFHWKHSPNFGMKSDVLEIEAKDAQDALFLFNHNFEFSYRSAPEGQLPKPRIRYVSGDDFEAGRTAERAACLTAVRDAIQSGVLPGDGCNPSAERDGLTIAANIIAARFNKPPA